jgi:hypothetical protein
MFRYESTRRRCASPTTRDPEKLRSDHVRNHPSSRTRRGLLSAWQSRHPPRQDIADTLLTGEDAIPLHECRVHEYRLYAMT